MLSPLGQQEAKTIYYEMFKRAINAMGSRTSCLVKLFSLLAFRMGTSNSLTSSRQSFVGVATFITCKRYLRRKQKGWKKFKVTINVRALYSSFFLDKKCKCIIWAFSLTKLTFLTTWALYMNQKLHNNLQIQSRATSKVLVASSFEDENVVHALQLPIVNHRPEFPQQSHSVICKDHKMKTRLSCTISSQHADTFMFTS